jgi:hypothetical protein
MSSHKESKKEETHTRISVMIYVIVGVALGFASLTISSYVGNILTIFLALVLAWLTGMAVQQAVGKRDVKWLIGNGLFIYIFVWLISWIFFFNLFGG